MNRTLDQLPNQAHLAPVRQSAKAKGHPGIAAARAMILGEFSWLNREQPRLVRLALDEAEALAWQAGFSHLFFPVLAMEKVSAVAAWHARQQSLRKTQPIRWFAA